MSEFDAINPGELLVASERAGGEPSGRVISLGCLENKVFWVHSEKQTDHIVKVYRRNRWSLDQLDVEHDFICALDAESIAVAAPLDLGDGYTIGEFEREQGCYFFAVYPRLMGRMKDELSLLECEKLGELIAQMHRVADTIDGNHERKPKDQLDALEMWLTQSTALPPNYRQRGLRWLSRLTNNEALKTQALIHGDCHLGNIIWDQESPSLIDFDDCGWGWRGQDLWLMAPGTDPEQEEKREALFAGYGGSISQFEIQENLMFLRALRMLNYTRWIAERWPDPAFVRAYPDFNQPVYFTRECHALDELELELMRR